MKLTFLGTSQGVPSPTRNCTAYMLSVGEVNYLIDAGAPVVELLTARGVALRSVRAIFTTHVHGDHTYGLIHFACLSHWFYVDVDVDIYLTEERAVNVFTDTVECMVGGKIDKNRIRFRVMRADTVYDDGLIRVTPIATAHMAPLGEPSYGYLIEAEGKTVLFTGDLSQDLAAADFPRRALEAPVDLVVSEFAHFSAEQIAPYLSRCQARRFCFTHIAGERNMADARAMGSRYGFPVTVPDDGDEIEI